MTVPWLSRLFGRDDADPTRAAVESKPDGSVVTTTSFAMSADTGMREVHDDLAALDTALSAHDEVPHATDSLA